MLLWTTLLWTMFPWTRQRPSICRFPSSPSKALPPPGGGWWWELAPWPAWALWSLPSRSGTCGCRGCWQPSGLCPSLRLRRPPPPPHWDLTPSIARDSCRSVGIVLPQPCRAPATPCSRSPTDRCRLPRVVAAIRRVPIVTPPPPPPAPTLGLNTIDREGQLQIGWDRSSPAVQGASDDGVKS